MNIRFVLWAFCVLYQLHCAQYTFSTAPDMLEERYTTLMVERRAQGLKWPRFLEKLHESSRAMAPQLSLVAGECVEGNSSILLVYKTQGNDQYSIMFDMSSSVGKVKSLLYKGEYLSLSLTAREHKGCMNALDLCLQRGDRTRRAAVVFSHSDDSGAYIVRFFEYDTTTNYVLANKRSPLDPPESTIYFDEFMPTISWSLGLCDSDLNLSLKLCAKDETLLIDVFDPLQRREYDMDLKGGLTCVYAPKVGIIEDFIVKYPSLGVVVVALRNFGTRGHEKLMKLFCKTFESGKEVWIPVFLKFAKERSSPYFSIQIDNDQGQCCKRIYEQKCDPQSDEFLLGRGWKKDSDVLQLILKNGTIIRVAPRDNTLLVQVYFEYIDAKDAVYSVVEFPLNAANIQKICSVRPYSGICPRIPHHVLLPFYAEKNDLILSVKISSKNKGLLDCKLTRIFFGHARRPFLSAATLFRCAELNTPHPLVMYYVHADSETVLLKIPTPGNDLFAPKKFAHNPIKFQQKGADHVSISFEGPRLLYRGEIVDRGKNDLLCTTKKLVVLEDNVNLLKCSEITFTPIVSEQSFYGRFRALMQPFPKNLPLMHSKGASLLEIGKKLDVMDKVQIYVKRVQDGYILTWQHKGQTWRKRFSTPLECFVLSALPDNASGFCWQIEDARKCVHRIMIKGDISTGGVSFFAGGDEVPKSH